MTNLNSLLALVVGIILFFLTAKAALILIALYLVVVGLLGLLATAAPAARPTVKPRIEPDTDHD